MSLADFHALRAYVVALLECHDELTELQAMRIAGSALRSRLSQDEVLALLTPFLLKAQDKVWNDLAVRGLTQLLGKVDENLKSLCTKDLKSDLLTALRHPAGNQSAVRRNQIQQRLLLAALLDRRPGFDEQLGQQFGQLMLDELARDASIIESGKIVESFFLGQHIRPVAALVDHPALSADLRQQLSIALVKNLLAASVRPPHALKHMDSTSLSRVCDAALLASDQEKMHLAAHLLDNESRVAQEVSRLVSSISSREMRIRLQPFVYHAFLQIELDPYAPRRNHPLAEIQIEDCDRLPLLQATLKIQVPESHQRERQLDAQAILTFVLDPDGLAIKPGAEASGAKPFTYPEALAQRRAILPELWKKVSQRKFNEIFPHEFIQDLRLLTQDYIAPEPADWAALLAELTAHRERAVALKA